MIYLFALNNILCLSKGILTPSKGSARYLSANIRKSPYDQRNSQRFCQHLHSPVTPDKFKLSHSLGLFSVICAVGLAALDPFLSKSSHQDAFADTLPMSEAIIQQSLTAPTASLSPPAVVSFLKDRIFQIRSEVTGEKVGQLRVGESLFQRLRSVDVELDALQKDLFKENGLDWDVIGVYPKIFRSFSPLFTAYTDRAFPTDSAIDTVRSSSNAIICNKRTET